jgi:hypothetical protein
VLTDETTNAVNGYGTGVPFFLGHLLMAMHQHKDAIGFDCFEYHNRQIYHDGRFRMYLYQTVDDFQGSEMYGPKKGTSGAKVYSVPLGGHSSCGPPGSWLKSTLLPYAGVYKSPELSWFYLKQRGWSKWNTDANYLGLRDFLYRGAATPKSPADSGWPLEAHFPTIGVHIMRSSWDGKASVVAARNGLVGSHGQPSQGQVIFFGSGYAVLGHVQTKLQGYDVAPYGIFYKEDPRTNSILFVDGKSQGNNRHTVGGTMKVLGPDTVEMDPSAAYDAVGIKVSWQRKVAYRRDLDVVLIEDTVSGGKAELMFNWVTEGTVISDTLYDMPGPYFMAARVVGSNTKLSAKNVKEPGPDVFPLLQVKVPAGSIQVRWAIGPGRALAEQAVIDWPLPTATAAKDAGPPADATLADAGPSADQATAPTADSGPVITPALDAASRDAGPAQEQPETLIVVSGGCSYSARPGASGTGLLLCMVFGLLLWRRRQRP